MDDFFTPKSHLALLDYAQTGYDHGHFRQAKVGKDHQSARIQDIRRDQICWIDDKNTVPAITTYTHTLQNLLQTLNQTFYLGLRSFEVHFAVYQPGDFYRKHRDQFQTTEARRISCVYYLNQDWHSGNGGELQLYDEQDKPLARIEPVGNRFVCFESQLLHEVYPTQKPRYSITGWLKTSR